MGILDLAKGAVSDMVSDKAAEIALSRLGDGNGQIQDILNGLMAGGLGTQVQSWLGSGENLPVSAAQIQSALDSDLLSGFAEKLNLSPESLSDLLATYLPDLADKLPK